MLRTRIIPVLMLHDESLVKPKQFGSFTYIGDPCNTVRIFNELEVDELILLDILASRKKTQPNLKLLADITSECFMPVAYGGGINSFEDAKAVFDIGIEKIVLNSANFHSPHVMSEIAGHFGSQAVVGSIDVKKTFWGRECVYSHGGRKNTKRTPVEWAKILEERGAGEILLTNIAHEGTWAGYDISLVQQVSDAVQIPVIAHGGAGKFSDIVAVINEGRASAAALGSMVVFQKKGMGVLVNFPDQIIYKET